MKKQLTAWLLTLSMLLTVFSPLSALAFSNSGEYTLPLLCVDAVRGFQNHIYIKGWAFDPDTPDAKLAVHVYINGEGHEIIADKYHDQSLDDTYHCGTDHGFALDIPTEETGVTFPQDGYLELNVLVDAIQATNTKAANDAWGNPTTDQRKTNIY